MTAHYTEISPDVLEAGEWVRGRWGILRWVPAPVVKVEPEPLPKPATEITACPTCKASMADPCRTESGKARRNHDDRTGPRTCICGAPPMLPKAKFCKTCKVARRRETFRESQARRAERQAALLEELYAERYPANWQTEGEVA